jgi:hypothetical protein
VTVCLFVCLFVCLCIDCCVPTACKTLFVYYDKIPLYELVYCVSCRSGSLRESSVCSKHPTLPKLIGVSHVSASVRVCVCC